MESPSLLLISTCGLIGVAIYSAIKHRSRPIRTSHTHFYNNPNWSPEEALQREAMYISHMRSSPYEMIDGRKVHYTIHNRTKVYFM